MFQLPYSRHVVLFLFAIVVCGVAWVLVWPRGSLEPFDQPAMAASVRAGFNLCQTRPGLPYVARAKPKMVQAQSCAVLERGLLLVLDLEKAVEDADADFRNGAFRPVGRAGVSGRGVVVPGLECASNSLRNAVYDASCLFVFPHNCTDFDAYARSYNTSFLQRSADSDREC